MYAACSYSAGSNPAPRKPPADADVHQRVLVPCTSPHRSSVFAHTLSYLRARNPVLMKY